MLIYTALARIRLALVSLAGVLVIPLLAGMAAAPARADSQEQLFRIPDTLPETIAMTEADLVGKTAQRLTHLGLRWISFDSGGKWQTRDGKNRQIHGTWQIRNGEVCLKGTSWYREEACWTFYGAGRIPVAMTTTGAPGAYQPVSLFSTADPSDGVGKTMPATHAAAGAFPFPVRTEKLFFKDRELVGWRIEMLTGSGDWFEFRSGGVLHYGKGGGGAERGKWTITEFGDLLITTGRFNPRQTYYELLGTRESGVVGMHSFDALFRYYPVRAKMAGS